MPNPEEISQPAQLALRSLADHPHLDTARAIDTGPYGIEQVNAEEIEAGLAGLAAMKLPRVLPKPGGGWRLAG